MPPAQIFLCMTIKEENTSELDCVFLFIAILSLACLHVIKAHPMRIFWRQVWHTRAVQNIVSPFFSKSKHWRQSSKTTGQLCLFYVADMFCIYNSFPSPQGLVIHAYPLWELSLDPSSFSKSWRTINESPNNRDSGFAGWVQSLVRHTLKLSFLFIFIGYFKIFKLK